MIRIAVCYDTWDGHTKKIAEFIVNRLKSHGATPLLCCVRDDEPPALGLFDAAIIGGSIRQAHHSRKLRSYVRKRHIELKCLPTAFFSVSLSAAGTEAQRDDARRVMDDFLLAVDWQPDRRSILAGALLYREYGFFRCWLMKLIVGQAGGDTDTSRNYEYTDWQRVEQFVDSFVECLRQTNKATFIDDRG